jgi:hypothetical protein
MVKSKINKQEKNISDDITPILGFVKNYLDHDYDRLPEPESLKIV